MAITQILRGDATGAVKAIQDLNKAIDGTEKEFGESAKSAKQLDAAARKVAENADPQKRYNRQMQDLAELVRKGKVQLGEAESQAKRYGTQLDNAGRSSSKSFGESAVQQLRNYYLGLMSIQAALGLIKEGFQEVEKAGQEAANNTFNSLGAQGEAAQLGPEGAKRVDDFAKELLASGVFLPTQGTQAFETSFILESARFTEADKQLIKRVGETRFVRPEKLTEFAGQLRKIQSNLDPESSLSQILDKVVAGAAVTQSNAGAIAGKVPEFANEAAALGLSPNEALAGFIAVEAGSPNPDIAATRYKSFLSRLDKSGLIVNNDLTDTLAAIDQQIAGGAKESEIVPDVRGLSALRSLRKKLPFLNEVEGLIAESEGTFEKSQNIVADLDPSFAAGLSKAAEEGKLGVARGGLQAEGELIFDAVIAARTRQLEEKYGVFGTAAGGIGGRFLDLFAQDRTIRFLRNREDFPETANPETLKRIDSYLQRIAAASETTADKVRATPASGRAE